MLDTDPDPGVFWEAGDARRPVSIRPAEGPAELFFSLFPNSVVVQLPISSFSGDRGPVRICLGFVWWGLPAVSVREGGGSRGGPPPRQDLPWVCVEGVVCDFYAGWRSRLSLTSHFLAQALPAWTGSERDAVNNSLEARCPPVRSSLI